MEKIEYERLYKRERTYWWNIGRRRILEMALRRHIPVNSAALEVLDVGCGAGGNILFLKNFGRVTGLDISEEALKFSRAEAFKDLVLGQAEALPFSDMSFGVVSILDCIEHLDDDLRALRECKRMLKDGGVLLLTVPAHQWLWSRHDEALHHKRRYTRSELEKKVRDAGFEIREISHFVIPAIPFLLFKKSVRRIKKMIHPNRKEIVDTYDVTLPRFLNKALIAWLALERVVMRYISIPLGSSLVVVAKKKAAVSKAVILAAGEGTRMRPLTLETPKPLLPINGRPILDHIFEALPEEITEVVVVVKYLGDKIKTYLGEEHRGKRVHYAEGSDKGTAYSLKAVEEFLNDGERFLFLYGDEMPLKENIEKCLRHPLGILVFNSATPETGGVALLRKDGTIAEIEEKPKKPKSNIVADGIMILDKSVFGYEPLPNSKGEFYLTSMLTQFVKGRSVRAVISDKFIGDITTPEDLKRVEESLR